MCVGLDPRWEQLPPALRSEGDSRPARAMAFMRFCYQIIDVVAGKVPLVKPQAAFFEQLGPAGCRALADVDRYARSRGLLVLLDAKRGDIGSTATAYADGLLGPDTPLCSDALTVNPYLGDDSLQPFVSAAVERGCGVFVLVKTSNPGGGQFQDLLSDGLPLYRHVARYVERLAAASAGRHGYGAVGAVVGATYPQQLAELRAELPHSWLLIPGYGSQGGAAADVLPGFDRRGLGAVVNNSRSLIFAYERALYRDRFAAADWADAVAAATDQMIADLAAAGAAPQAPA